MIEKKRKKDFLSFLSFSLGRDVGSDRKIGNNLAISMLDGG
jgi:hypothetical protein